MQLVVTQAEQIECGNQIGIIEMVTLIDLAVCIVYFGGSLVALGV